MSNVIIAIVIPIFTAVIGAIVGVIFQNIVYPSKGNNQSNYQQNFVGNTVILDYKNIQLNKDRIIKKEVVREKIIIKERRETKSEDDSVGLMIMSIFLIGALLIWCYLKFENIILYALLICTIFIVSMCLSAVYAITRKRILIDSRLKSVIIWIVISTLFIPINIYFLINPIYYKTVNKNLILDAMNNNGILSIFTQGVDVFGFLLYQVIGILIAIIFIIHLLLGNIHIWAMINLELNSRMKSFWRFLYRKTFFFTSSRLYFIGFSAFLLLLSFIFSSGLLANLISKL